MNRRHFLSLAAMAPLAMSLAPWAAQAAVDFTPGLVKQALANGETVFLTFNTEWCSTCAAQKRVIKDLLSQNPEYEKKITFIDVDWDQHSKSDLAKSLRIPRRSTLVTLHQDEELGRIVAGTSKADIQALLDQALKAAQKM
jgi:glutaredoxin